jgi:tetratricopeptide (TPR) repeat protein
LKPIRSKTFANTQKINAAVAGGKLLPKSELQTILAKIEALASRKSIAEVLLKTIADKDVASAIQQYHDLKATQSSAYEFGESELRIVKYQLASMNRVKDSIEICKLWVEVYPKSDNGYAALAEAYLTAGDKELAMKNCQKALELNPKNTNAVGMFKKLQAS